MTQREWVEKVKIAMIKKGVRTQKELADLVGVQAPVISDLFKYGKGSNRVIEKINELLGLKR